MIPSRFRLDAVIYSRILTSRGRRASGEVNQVALVVGGRPRGALAVLLQSPEDRGSQQNRDDRICCGVETGLTAALRLQSPSVDVVALEARKIDGQPDPGPVPLALALKRVAPIHDGRHGQPDHPVVVPSDPRPLPTVHQYDQLLTHRNHTKAQAM